MTQKQEIWNIADSMTAQGLAVSVRSVRERRGGGSLRDIAAHLSAWRAARPAPLLELNSSDAIARSEHERLLQEVEDRFESERRRLLRETDAIRQGIAAPHLLRIRSLEKRVQEQERELLVAEHDLDQLRRRLAEVEASTEPKK